MRLMRSYFLLLSIIITSILWSSCRSDFEYEPSVGNLEFSKDTVFLDTVFASISSTTGTLKVYNRSRNDIEIPSIRLKQGQNSSYRLNVDGEAGKEFNDIPVLAQDSIYIFIESTYVSDLENQVEFLNTDVIQFDSGDFLQEVQLVSLIKDAIFLYPKTLADGTKEALDLGLDGNGNTIRIEGFYLSDEQLNFNNQKPYVIYGYAAVADSKELIIDAGTRLYFHKDSGILVEAGGRLEVNGSISEDENLLENEVLFEGDRLSAEFARVPGQWGTIWLAEGSTNNTINHLTIKNATVGIFVEGERQLQTTTLKLTNSQIYNSARINLWGKSAAIEAENLVLGGAGATSLYCNLGGSYSFIHCTIANYWNQGFRLGAALAIDNFSVNEGTDLIKAAFSNCIIDGNTRSELRLMNNGTNQFAYEFSNCLLKFDLSNSQITNDPLYDFQNSNHYRDLILNQDANYIDKASSNFRITDPSAARDKASFGSAQQVPFDLAGIDRTGSPDIGAYEVLTDN